MASGSKFVYIHTDKFQDPSRTNADDRKMFKCVVKLLSNRQNLLALFSLNAFCLGVLILVVYDTGISPTRNPHQRAYERWKHIRENFNDFQREETLKESMKQKFILGGQPDAVVGFDAFRHADDTNEANVKNRIIAEELRIKEADQSLDAPLEYVPPIPEHSETDTVPYFSRTLMDRHLTLPKIDYSYRIVILTPICDVAHVLKDYIKALAGLTYPHDLISVFFGEDSSSDRTFDMAKLLAVDLVSKHGFASADAFHFNISGGVHGAWGDVHLRTSQFARRSHLAKARNMLLNKATRTAQYDYVLWIDSDVKTLPNDLIEQLLYADTDIVVPSCLFHHNNLKKVFDKNSWRETPLSLQDQKDIPHDVLIVEGYSHTLRIYLPDLKAEGRVVPLDGVGGCVLMIKTSCHRKGLEFPQRVYNHHIETEGLAKMAANMGFKVMGLPWLEVFHQ